MQLIIEFTESHSQVALEVKLCPATPAQTKKPRSTKLRGSKSGPILRPGQFKIAYFSLALSETPMMRGSL